MRRCFAYGSNLSLGQIRVRCPDAVLLGVARLPGYRLAFTRESRGWGGGVADIVAHQGSSVWGAVYELTSRDLEELDAFEGVPTAYRRALVRVEMASGGAVEAWAYVVVNKKPEMLPSYGYWRTVVEGAAEVGLPSDYQAMLAGLAHLPR